jgi:16S rRNA (adenine1518-N6/adenine1519-N6)-dimethyltransferase
MTFPKKSYGQHFLHDQSVINKIIAAAEITKDDLVIEVGPGTGALTTKIVQITSPILIEADRELIPDLKANYPQAEVVFHDAAQVDYDELTKGKSWIFISNLPYNAGNAIVMKVLMAKNPPKHLIVMVQKEVGERMLGLHGSEGVLSVAVGLYAHVSKVCKVAPGAFNPPPQVDSVVLKLAPFPSSIDREKVIALAKIGFGKRRKQLHGNFSEAGVAESAKVKELLENFGLSPLARAEELSLENWIELTDSL